MGTVSTIEMYEVCLCMFVDRNEQETSSSYYTRKDDAIKTALSLCRQWLENPYHYLVTTVDNDIRVYDKILEEPYVTVHIRKHEYVEVS